LQALDGFPEESVRRATELIAMRTDAHALKTGLSNERREYEKSQRNEMQELKESIAGLTVRIGDLNSRLGIHYFVPGHRLSLRS
jgi:hypothetical protein